MWTGIWLSQLFLSWAKFWSIDTLVDEFGIMYVYKSNNDGLRGSIECGMVDGYKSTKIITSIYLGELDDWDTPSVSEYGRLVVHAVCLPDALYDTLIEDLFGDNSDALTVTEIAYSVSKPYKDRLLSRPVEDFRDLAHDENLYVMLPSAVAQNLLVPSVNNTIIFEQILSLLSRESHGQYIPWTHHELGSPRSILKSRKNVGSSEVDVSVDSYRNGAIIRRTTSFMGAQRRIFNKISTHNSSEEINPCPICLDGECSVNQSTLPCGHVFHDECIRSWTEDTCPICRVAYTRIGMLFVV